MFFDLFEEDVMQIADQIVNIVELCSWPWNDLECTYSFFSLLFINFLIVL